MKKERLKRKFELASVLCGVVIWGVTAGAATPEPVVPEGAGTASNPYQITCVENLLWMSVNVGFSSGKYYKLQNDIDASSSANWDTGRGFIPIGSEASKFSGNLDGANFTISGVTLRRSSTSHVGLLGWMEGGSVKNLNLKNASILGRNYVSLLVGYANGATLTGCCVEGEASGDGNYVGGIAGQAYRTPIARCSASEVDLSAVSYVGGLVGENLTGTTLNQCYATGTLRSSGNGATSVGGLSGWSHDAIGDCYAKCSVTGVDRTGGLTGQNSSTITHSYAAGSVYGKSNVGGIAGYSNTSVSSSFWNTQTSGLTVCIGNNKTFGKNLGLTTQQMKQRSSYGGWNFSSIWGQSASQNEGYPYLMAFTSVSLPPIQEGLCLYYSTGQDGLVLEWSQETGAVLEYSENAKTGWTPAPIDMIWQANGYNLFSAGSTGKGSRALFYRLVR